MNEGGPRRSSGEKEAEKNASLNEGDSRRSTRDEEAEKMCLCRNLPWVDAQEKKSQRKCVSLGITLERGPREEIEAEKLRLY